MSVFTSINPNLFINMYYKINEFLETFDVDINNSESDSDEKKICNDKIAEMSILMKDIKKLQYKKSDNAA